jgi:hypothetical protein
VSNEVIDWLSCVWSNLLIVLIQYSRWLWSVMAPGSMIYAVDLDRRILEGIPEQHDGVEIRKIVGGLQSSSLRLPPADGILMTNTLYFIQEQQALPAATAGSLHQRICSNAAVSVFAELTPEDGFDWLRRGQNWRKVRLFPLCEGYCEEPYDTTQQSCAIPPRDPLWAGTPTRRAPQRCQPENA